MRILYFADIRFPLERANGIQTMETCHALAERGHHVALVVKPDTHDPPRDPFEFYGLRPFPTGDGRGAERGRLFVERANAPSGSGALARIGYLSFVLGRAFGSGRADILMTRDLGVAAMLLGLPRQIRAPLVYESHGYAPDVAQALPAMIATAQPPSASKVRRLAAREGSVWRRADGYVAITRGIIEHMQGLAGPRPRTAVVPDGVRLSGTATPMPAEPVVGYAGHLYAWKGVDILLRAMPFVHGARLLIVGGHEQEPDLARLKAVAAELGITDRVTFTGLLEPARVPGQLARARVLVLPNPSSAISTHFTSPLKLFEYMAAGRAIVAADLPAIREVIRDGDNGVLVEPGKPEAFAAAISTLLANREMAERLARTAREEAANYTWTRRAERLEALFAEVLAA